MTDTAHEATREEMAEFWAGEPVTHPAADCDCPTAADLLDLTAIHDAVWVDDEPVRTKTACRAIQIRGVCTCTEWIEGRTIAGQTSCLTCTHTIQSHQPRKQGKQVRRS